ncbi:MAG: esterase [Bacteroidales bacterium]|nr:esterase [Bacteroidales bacterium]
MKKLFLIVAAALFCVTFAANAQELSSAPGPVDSPQVNPDGTVTFRFQDKKAVKVQVTGDFLPSQTVGRQEVQGVVDMVEGPNGVWEFTTGKLAPEFYGYKFIVDGVTIPDPANLMVCRDGAVLTTKFLIPGGRADLYAIHDVPHGTVSHIWYPSPIAGFDRRMTVYTPAGYEANTKTRYPVVYILHGIGGDEDSWLTHGRAAQILDNMIASGKVKPMIAVFTNGNISQQAAVHQTGNGYIHQTTMLPKTMEGTFETAFNEVVNFIDKNYRTIAKKQSRAICGLSMGGFHSLYISANNPDLFGYVGLFSAAVGVTDESVSPIYQNLDAKLAKQFAGKPFYYIACGDSDFLYQANKEYMAKLDKAGYPYTYLETDGGHIWRNWRIYLTEYLPLIFK